MWRVVVYGISAIAHGTTKGTGQTRATDVRKEQPGARGEEMGNTSAVERVEHWDGVLCVRNMRERHEEAVVYTKHERKMLWEPRGQTRRGYVAAKKERKVDIRAVDMRPQDKQCLHIADGGSMTSRSPW